MGAGDDPAGDGLAGEDALVSSGPPRSVTPPVALRFDGATADYPLDSEGRYVSIHPVDQRVALALIPRLGTVASVPELGNGLRSIRKITRATPNEARSHVDRALASLIRAGDIRLLSVAVETHPRTGAILCAVSYTNLRTSPPSKSALKVNLNAS